VEKRQYAEVTCLHVIGLIPADLAGFLERKSDYRVRTAQKNRLEFLSANTHGNRNRFDIATYFQLDDKIESFLKVPKSSRSSSRSEIDFRTIIATRPSLNYLDRYFRRLARPTKLQDLDYGALARLLIAYIDDARAVDDKEALRILNHHAT
jgi:hypothetical protein